MPPTFYTGYRLCVVEHPRGDITKYDVFDTYQIVFFGTQRQGKRIETDWENLKKLSDDSMFFCVMRQQTAEREGADVRLTEYGLDGFHTPVFASEAIIWDSGKAREINAMLLEEYNGNTGNTE